MRPSHRTTRLTARQPIPATPKRSKEAKELKEKLPAWSATVAEYEHQFKVIDEAQKTFGVREMMPEDTKREFLTGQEIQRNRGKVADHWRNQGRRRTSSDGSGECQYARCENDAE